MEKSNKARAIIALQRQGQHELARHEFESTKGSLTTCEVDEILGNAAFYERNFQEAVTAYERAIKRSPDYPIAAYQYLVGFNHVQSSKFVDAFKCLQYAIEIDPSFVEPYVELGFLLMKVEDYSGAAVCYEDALRIQPNDLANYHNAVQAYEQLARLDPNTHSTNLARARNQYEAAKKRLPAANNGFKWRLDA